MESCHIQDIPHKINPKGKFGLESIRSQINSFYANPYYPGKDKEKILEVSMSIWASYSNAGKAFHFP